MFHGVLTRGQGADREHHGQGEPGAQDGLGQVVQEPDDFTEDRPYALCRRRIGRYEDQRPWGSGYLGEETRVMAVLVLDERVGQRMDEGVGQSFQGGLPAVLVQGGQQLPAVHVHPPRMAFEDLPDELFLAAEVVLGR